MYVKITDFTEDWTREMSLTQKVMDALSDESLFQAVVPQRRTLGQIAWHLVESMHYMTHCGLDFQGPEGGGKPPLAAAILAEEYRRVGGALLNAVQSQWSDERLHDTVEVMGEPWANGASLRFTVMHQAHHRGQMTVLMRQAGLRVPDVYGPTYDSWVDQGLAPLA